MSIVLKQRIRALEDKVSIMEGQLNKLNTNEVVIGGVPQTQYQADVNAKKTAKTAKTVTR